TRSLALVPIVALCAHALVCMGMLMMHHYLDAPMDAAAVPPKRTTVVAIGFPNSKRYAAGIAFVAALLYGILGLTTHPAFLLGFALTLPAVLIHLRTNPTDLESVTRNELRIIQLGIAAGLSTAVGLAPVLWPMLPLAVLGYVAHLAVVSPPAELGRAWRRAPGPGPLRIAEVPPNRIEVVHVPGQPSTSEDTRIMVEESIASGVELILFCGGDGTARDVAAVAKDRVPIVGIPAGVKMHSGLFAISPQAAANLLVAFLRGDLRVGTAEIL